MDDQKCFSCYVIRRETNTVMCRAGEGVQVAYSAGSTGKRSAGHGLPITVTSIWWRGALLLELWPTVSSCPCDVRFAHNSVYRNIYLMYCIKRDALRSTIAYGTLLLSPSIRGHSQSCDWWRGSYWRSMGEETIWGWPCTALQTTSILVASVERDDCSEHMRGQNERCEQNLFGNPERIRPFSKPQHDEMP